MNDAAYGAHKGMTVQMEHTKDWDPVTDDAANGAHCVLSSFPRVSKNIKINMY